MVRQMDEQFADYDCVRLENNAVALWITRNVGPRVIGLRLTGGENLLAVLPMATATTPGGNLYHFRGGHRLWHAPEDPERTYVPDDSPVSVIPTSRGIHVVQDVEASTGIEKQMTITLPDDEAHVVIDHRLVNRGLWTVALAPWAITQLRPGGFAILPQNVADTGLLPNRRISLWPYSRIDSPHLQMGNRFIFVHATMQDEQFKLGWANPAGWLGYWVDGTLFVKRSEYDADGDYLDFGSSAECYCDGRFLELETAGPRVTLEPGAAVTHRETWRVYRDVPMMAEEETAVRQLKGLGILA